MRATDQHLPQSWLERLPVAIDRPWIGIGATIALSAGAFVLRYVADPLLPAGFPFLTFFPAVILSSFLFGAWVGTLGAVLCGLLSLYFLNLPTGAIVLPYQSAFALGFYVLVVATDIAIIHWMQRANTHLARERAKSVALAQTRELLFNELQHRVSNNLQVTAGLLSLQKRRLDDPRARHALDEASRRLALIGRISRQLYDAAGATRDMRAFLDPLCADVMEASGRDGIRYAIDVDEGASVAPDTAIPLALIVAEAIANAIEHGFHGRDTGRIDIRLTRADAHIRVEICDDGHGLPPGFSLEASDSLGLRIATMLAQQLNGRFELVGGAGTTARIEFPA